MLVLSRRIGERIFIEPNIEIAIVKVRGSKVQIGIDAPEAMRIRRVDTPPGSGFRPRVSMTAAAHHRE
jgi:carbon storage regulator CsrA